jgi:pimeloyl-ACP methyl ester carboxylesterase
VSHALDQALGPAAPVEADPERVAVLGHSFGGWTTLMAAGLDPRVRAAVPLAPAGGETDLPVNPFEDRLSLAWEREVPTLFVVAERDSLLPLRGMHGLLERTPGPRRMVILEDTDHQHFCDNAEQIHELFRAMRIPGPWSELDLPGRMAPFSELVPAAHAEEAVRGLALAHLDAHLRERDEAHSLLADAAATLAARGLRGKLV